MKFKLKPVVLLIIAFVGIVALILIVNSFLGGKNSETNTPGALQVEEKEALLYFTPNTITASFGGKITSEIKVDAGDTPVSYIKVAISYDPKLLSNVTLMPVKDPTSAISNSMISEVENTDLAKGTITLTYTLINGAYQQKGQAILAKFSANYVGDGETSVQILPESLVSTKSQEYKITTGRVNLDIFPRK